MAQVESNMTDAHPEEAAEQVDDSMGVNMYFRVRNSWGFLHALFRVFKVRNDAKAHQTV